MSDQTAIDRFSNSTHRLDGYVHGHQAGFRSGWWHGCVLAALGWPIVGFAVWAFTNGACR